jgi:hypothetical protein
MKISVDIDILIGCAKLLKEYFLVQEFSASKISSYDMAIYKELNNIISKAGKDEVLK